MNYWPLSKGPGNYGVAPLRRQVEDDWREHAPEWLAKHPGILDPEYSFYHLVPKDLDENLEYRRALNKWANASLMNKRVLWMMCARDPLFWMNTYTWTFNPKLPVPCVPFITWDFQDDLIDKVLKAINVEDLAVEKTREMGASWIILTCFTWKWQFAHMQSFLLASRVEDLVDDSENLDALMPKIDFLLRFQPQWLVPVYNRRHLHIYNTETGSVIDGCSTTENMGRGGRRAAMLIDEMAAVNNGEAVLASTADVTQCRIMASTPKGAANAFYTVSHSKTRVISMHWTFHPEKRRGLYYYDEGKGKKIDCEHLKPKQISSRGGRWAYYGDHKLRSPWYDRECERRHSGVEIASELDIDYMGSDRAFFDNNLVQRMLDQSSPPYLEGYLQYTEEGHFEQFRPEIGGSVKLWMDLDAANRPTSATTYTVGCDIATGSGASNSVAKVLDNSTGRFVCEYADPNIEPHEFAILVVALCRWFASEHKVIQSGDSPRSEAQGAHLVWETGGPGVAFGRKVIKLGYRNIYYRAKVRGEIYERASDIPGWTGRHAGKVELLGDYKDQLASGEIAEPSTQTCQEMLSYKYRRNGELVHSASEQVDPSGAGDNHGDRVIAAAVAAMGRRQLPKSTRQIDKIPVNCLYHRQKAFDAEQRKLAEEEMTAW